MKIFVLTRTNLFSLLCLVVAAVCVVVSATAANAVAVFGAATQNWGLGFGAAGTAPSGTLSSEKLSQYNACYVGNTEEKNIYLTFDAGFEAGYTNQILDILKEKWVPAAFFLVGNVLDTEPELVKRMANEGHIVGNHSLSHPDMTRMDSSSVAKQLTAVEEKYRNITGREMPKFFRPPEGKFNEALLTAAKDAGYKTVFWSLAYVDWEKTQKTKDYAFKKLIPRLHDGCILLLHSTSATNAEILGEFIDKCLAEGYTFKSLSEL